MPRTSNPAADAVLDQKIPCLDHGYVQPIDYMGIDQDIVQAARVSYGPSTKAVQSDRGLLRYLMRHAHSSPFEMCEAKFICKMPIFVARQWVRHRTANLNEMSLRYSAPIDEFYIPDFEHIQSQSATNKQGRGEDLTPEQKKRVQGIILDHQRADLEAYQDLADVLGLARELSRTVLPVSIYTKWVWKCDVRNILHFLGLRMDSHAQYEIRVYANAIARFIKTWLPMTWEAFEDYGYFQTSYSRLEQRILAKCLDVSKLKTLVKDDMDLTPRERREFRVKVAQMLKCSLDGGVQSGIEALKLDPDTGLLEGA